MSRPIEHLLLSLVFATGLAIGLAACSDDTTPSGTAPETGSDATDAGGDAEVSTDAVEEDTVTPDIDTPDIEVPDGGDADVIRPDVPVSDGVEGDTFEPPLDEMRIVAVTPERGPTAGGTEILVIGIGFTVDTDIFIGGVMCENIDFVDDTKILCDTPANDAGHYDVKAANSLQLVSLDSGFSYFAPILLENISPDRGPTGGGMPTTITGSGFMPSSQVSLGGRVALGIEVIDENTIRLLTPPGDAGDANVQVSNENGLSIIEDGFDYFQPISIDRILPGAGHRDGGTEVVIQGAGFVDADGEPLELTVDFGLLSAAFDITEAGDIVATSPQGPSDAFVDVTVASVDSGEFTAVDGFYYFDDIVASPVIHNVAPDTGSTEGGDLVVISGVDVGDATMVRFGTELATIEARATTTSS